MLTKWQSNNPFHDFKFDLSNKQGWMPQGEAKELYLGQGSAWACNYTRFHARVCTFVVCVGVSGCVRLLVPLIRADLQIYSFFI